MLYFQMLIIFISLSVLFLYVAIINYKKGYGKGIIEGTETILITLHEKKFINIEEIAKKL